MNKFTLLFILFATQAFSLCTYSPENIQTYYNYSESEIQHLKDVSSEFIVTRDSLKKWDDKAAQLVKVNNLDYYEFMRMFTYLYVAQEEAAALSTEAHNSLMGSLDPLCEAIIRLFCSKYTRPESYESDIYSAKLRNLIVPKLKERMRKENRSDNIFKLHADLKKNPETNYSLGTNVAKWIPWVITNPESYWPKPPPETDEEWAYQIAELKRYKADLTPEQHDKMQFWAGKTGPFSGEWLMVMNDYIFSNDIEVGKILFARSQFVKAFYDTSIVYYGAKYHYSVIRPRVRDPSIEYEIEMPNHPSYPSGHSSLGGVSSTILSFYFPENKEEWHRLAIEAGETRLWGGIHYPIDHQVGLALGRKVANTVLESCPKGQTAVSLQKAQ